jgi:hypothetical protein
MKLELTLARLVMLLAAQILSVVLSFLVGMHRAEAKAQAEMQQYLKDRDRGVQLYKKSVENQGKELDKWRLNP